MVNLYTSSTPSHRTGKSLAVIHSGERYTSAVLSNLLHDTSPPVLALLAEKYGLQRIPGLNAQALISRILGRLADGVTYFSSEKISCPECLKRQYRNGTEHFYHSAITPVIVKPGCRQVLSRLHERLLWPQVLLIERPPELTP